MLICDRQPIRFEQKSVNPRVSVLGKDENKTEICGRGCRLDMKDGASVHFQNRFKFSVFNRTVTGIFEAKMCQRLN